MKNFISLYLFQPDADDIKVINALTSAFANNPRMRVLIGKTGKRFTKSLQFVILYCYFMVKKVNGIYSSTSKTTFLLYYKKSEFYFSWKDCLRYLHMAFFIIGFSRIPAAFKREKQIKSIRQKEKKKHKDHDFLYVWFLAQCKAYKKIDGLLEAKNHLIKTSKLLQIPIYMETTEERLLSMYKRMGFHFYNAYKDNSTNLTVWFGRFDPNY